MCLRMVWTGDAALLEPLKPENLAEGQNFVDRAAKQVKANQQAMRMSFSCLDRSKIDPKLLEQAAGLEMGQASGPFELSDGWAMVQLSSKSFGQEGKAFFLQGRYGQAEPLLKKDLKLNPDAVTSLHMLGLCEVAKGNHQQAIAYFDRALELVPRNPAVLGDKASSELALGREDQAISLYHQALAMNGENPVVLNNLAWVLARRGKEMARAESLARRAVALAPDKAALWVTQGEILAARGKHAEAVVSLHRALELNPQEPETRRRLLESLEKLSPEDRQPFGRLAYASGRKAQAQSQTHAKAQGQGQTHAKVQGQGQSRAKAQGHARSHYGRQGHVDPGSEAHKGRAQAEAAGKGLFPASCLATQTVRGPADPQGVEQTRLQGQAGALAEQQARFLAQGVVGPLSDQGRRRQGS